MDAKTPPSGGVYRLPPEVLKKIFSYLQDSRVVGPGHLAYDQDHLPVAEFRGAIASARLTCRLFNSAASEFLVAERTVSLDQESLNKLARFTREPLFARGVHGLRVCLAYRYKRMTEDRREFVRYRIQCMRRLLGIYAYNNQGERAETCRAILRAWEKEARAIGGAGPGNGAANNGPFADDADDRDPFAPDLDDSEPSDDSDDDGPSAEYRSILRRGFFRFRQKHSQQRRLLETGSLLRQLVASMSRLPLCRTLHFSELEDLGVTGIPGTRPVTASMSALSEWLTGPYTWGKIEDLAAEAGHPDRGELAPARLLVDLPVALQRADRPVHHFQVDYTPSLSHNIALLTNKASNAADPEEDDLKAAFASLVTATFPYVSTTDYGRDFERYLAAVTSGSRLRALRLNGGWDMGAPLHASCLVHPDISSFATHNLRHVQVSDVFISTGEMGRFCAKVDIGRVLLLFRGITRQRGELAEDWQTVVYSVLERANKEGVLLHVEWTPGQDRKCSFIAHTCGNIIIRQCSLCQT